MPRPALLAAALAILVAASFSPPLQPVPGRDSGAYLYIGAQILAGHLPYRDVWENKPPLIYFIDALGLFLGGGSRWGVWALETVALATAAIIGWRVLARAFGSQPATVASLAWILTLPLVLERGNLTEEFALPLQFAALALVTNGGASAVGLRGIGLGILLGATFLLRQNLIGTPLLACLLFLGSRGAPTAMLRAGAVLALGLLVTVGSVAAYLVGTGAFDAMLDQTFGFHAAYSSGVLSRQGLAGQGRALFEGLRLTTQSGLAFLSLAGWFGTLAVLVTTWRLPSGTLLRLGLLALPLEFVLATFSGRWYPHYFTPWLPAAAILVAALVAAILRADSPEQPLAVAHQRAWLGGLIVAMAVLPALRTAHEIVRGDPLRARAVAYVRGATAPTDRVLVWGAEPVVNFLAGRRAPTRFVHGYPLGMAGYTRPAFFAELLEDLARTPPVLVIDATATTSIVPPLDILDRGIWPGRPGATAPPEMHPVLRHVRERYARVDTIDEWVVYRLRTVP